MLAVHVYATACKNKNEMYDKSRKLYYAMQPSQGKAVNVFDSYP